jgi:succinate dehydrogenase / fumarate reductase cytochrome b subunit
MSSRAPSDEARSPLWIRLQRAIGLVPLSLFAVFHLWQNWAALESREAWFERARTHALGIGWAVFVLGLLALHAVLGLARVRRRRSSPAATSGGRSRFAALTGVVLSVFLVYHVVHVWPAASGAAHATLADGYGRLWQLLGRPLPLVLYVLGSGALAFHLAHGWARSLEEHVSAAALRVAVRYVAGAAGLALFVLYMQLVGRFALGEAAVPLERAEQTAAPVLE